jgi:hypothetical protein
MVASMLNNERGKQILQQLLRDGSQAKARCQSVSILYECLEGLEKL